MTYRLQTRPDVHDIPIFHGIFLPFESQLPLRLRFIHPPEADEVVVRHHLRPNETLRQIGVDLARRLLRRRAALRLPRADLVLADGEERLHLEQIIR